MKASQKCKYRLTNTYSIKPLQILHDKHSSVLDQVAKLSEMQAKEITANSSRRVVDIAAGPGQRHRRYIPGKTSAYCQVGKGQITTNIVLQITIGAGRSRWRCHVGLGECKPDTREQGRSSRFYHHDACNVFITEASSPACIFPTSWPRLTLPPGGDTSISLRQCFRIAVSMF